MMLKKSAASKFNEKVEVGIFLGYSTPLKWVYNKSTGNVEEWFEVNVQKYLVEPPGKGHAWMFDYQGLFDSFNLPPDHTEEELVVQMMYDAQNAHDGQTVPSSALLPVESDVSEDEAPTEPTVNVNSNENTAAEPTGECQNTNPDPTNLNPSVTVPTHPVTRVNKNHPQD